MIITRLFNVLLYEPTHNGHINDKITDELEKHDEEHNIFDENKITDGPIAQQYSGLGSDENQFHKFLPLVMGFFFYTRHAKYHAVNVVHSTQKKVKMW